MAATLDDVVKELRNLSTTLSRSGSFGGGSSRGGAPGPSPTAGLTKALQASTAEELRSRKALGEYAKIYSNTMMNHGRILSTFADDILAQGSVIGDMFGTAIHEFSTKQLEEVPKKLTEQLARTTNTAARFMLTHMNSVEDLLGFKSLADHLTEFQKIHEEYTDAVISADTARQDAAMDAARALGIHTDLLNENLDDVNKAVVEFGQGLGNVLDQSDLSTKRVSDSMSRASQKVGEFVNQVRRLGEGFYTLASSAARTGTAVETWRAWMLGMQGNELNEIQARYRKTIEATGQSLNDFNDLVNDQALEQWKNYGDLTQIAKIHAATLEQATIAGADYTTTLEKSNQVFTTLQGKMGLLPDQFEELVQSMANDESVREKLYRMNKREAALYPQQLMSMYNTIGAYVRTTDQLKKVASALQGFDAQDPTQRFEQGAALQALAGSMGLGDIGAELNQLARQGQLGSERGVQLMSIIQEGMKGIAPDSADAFRIAMFRDQIPLLKETKDLALESNTQDHRDSIAVKESVDANKTVLDSILNTIAPWFQRAGSVLDSPIVGPIKDLVGKMAEIGIVLFGVKRLLMSMGGLAAGAGGAAGAGLVGKMLMGGARAGAAGLATWFAWEGGYWIGENIYKSFTDNMTKDSSFGDWWIDNIGGGMAKVWSLFSDEAAEAVAMREKNDAILANQEAQAQKQREQESVAFNQTMKGLTESMNAAKDLRMSVVETQSDLNLLQQQSTAVAQQLQYVQDEGTRQIFVDKLRQLQNQREALPPLTDAQNALAARVNEMSQEIQKAESQRLRDGSKMAEDQAKQLTLLQEQVAALKEMLEVQKEAKDAQINTSKETERQRKADEAAREQMKLENRVNSGRIPSSSYGYSDNSSFRGDLASMML